MLEPGPEERKRATERSAARTGDCLGLSPCLLAEGMGSVSSRGMGHCTPPVAGDPAQGAPGETASLT